MSAFVIESQKIMNFLLCLGGVFVFALHYFVYWEKLIVPYIMQDPWIIPVLLFYISLQVFELQTLKGSI